MIVRDGVDAYSGPARGSNSVQTAPQLVRIMENIKSWSAEDEAIIATNTDATECKRSAVELGYWKDEYIGYFAKRADRKAPEINRGYYARVKGMEMFIHQFLEVRPTLYCLAIGPPGRDYIDT